MERFFFHLHDRVRLLEDNEGINCETLDEARMRAIATARDVMVGELRKGHLNLSWYILITDEQGNVAAHIPFREAVVVYDVAE
ncbi:DUF6894 family protein [Sphingomonas sp. R1]|uniref:DUF6894 family protein n=1 Tax=Sphingomonas sp. R1 TaxID=399176 RepID=UPI00222508FA|nr:hypothetical protein [Sphingomonas sp. R1]UYY76859.1 hypothetical protein OIM94_15325 [Sphingomonas sp. R1]